LIITCKGVKYHGIIQNCSFLHDGNWGDQELEKHQLSHETTLEKDSFWLGFDAVLSIGRFSGRDGKYS